MLRLPTYYARVLALDGSVVAAPLECAGAEFEEKFFVPGQEQPGTFTLQLHDTRLPQFLYLRSAYALLDYEQRVELYDNPDLAGNPVFAGAITGLPSDTHAAQVTGEDVRHYIANQQLRRYESFSLTATEMATRLLRHYVPVFKDSFDVSLDPGWTTGSATVASGWVRLPVSPAGVLTSPAWSSANWNDCRVSFDLSVPPQGRVAVYFYENATASKYYVLQISQLIADVSAQEQNGKFEVYYAVSAGTPVKLAERMYPFLYTTFYHFDIATALLSDGRHITIDLNGIELFNLVDSHVTVTGVADVEFDSSADAGITGNIRIDNFVFSVFNAALQPGTLTLTNGTNVVKQQFNADKRWAAFDWLMAYMGWAYRLNYRAGLWQDTLDYGTGIGADWSGVLVFEEGTQLVELQKDATSEELATTLFVYGQAADDTTANMFVSSLAAFDRYGIIDGDFSDPRVVDTATAKLIGQSRLALTSQGNVSLSGTVIDESYLLLPVGSSVRVGDYVWLRYPSKGIDKKVRIVGLRRTSGVASIAVTFDYFGWTRALAQKKLDQQYRQLYRAFINRMNTQGPIRLTAANAATLTRYPYFFGQVNRIDLRVKVVAGAGNLISLSVDGVDVTALYAGPWGDTFNLHNVAELRLSGEHQVDFVVPAAMTLDVWFIGHNLA